MDATTSVCIGTLLATGSVTPTAECTAWMDRVSAQSHLEARVEITILRDLLPPQEVNYNNVK